MADIGNRKLRQRIGIKLIGAALVITGFVILLHSIIAPNVIRTLDYNTKATVITAIGKAVTGSLENLSESSQYNALVKLTYDGNGRVTSVQSNVAAVNRLKSDILSDINDSLSENGFRSVELSLGTLSGISALYTFGGAVTLNVEPKGFATADFISAFTGSGINQTLHRMIMRVKVSVTSYIPFFITSTDVCADFPIAETVIVGVIPESYTHVVTAEEDVVDNINDFGAKPIED